MNREFLRVSATLLIISSALLSACGGGSSQSDKKPPTSIATPTPVTVSAEVKGLIGTGLAVSLNGETIVIPASGTFAFPTQLQQGTELNLTVTNQPEFPNFVCRPEASGTTVAQQPITLIVNCSYFEQAAHEHASREPLFFNASESGDIVTILRDETFDLSIDRRAAGEDWQGLQNFYRCGSVDMPNPCTDITRDLTLLNSPTVDSEEIYIPIAETHTTEKRLKYLRKTLSTAWEEFTIANLDKNTYPRATRSGNRVAFFYSENGSLISHTGDIAQTLTRTDLGRLNSGIWTGTYKKQDANLPIATLTSFSDTNTQETQLHVLLDNGTTVSKSFDGRLNGFALHRVLENQRQMFIWSRERNITTETAYVLIEADGSIGDDQILSPGYLANNKESLTLGTLAITVNDFNAGTYKVFLWSESKGFSTPLENSDTGYANLDLRGSGEIVVAFWTGEYLKIVPFEWSEGWGEDHLLYNFDNINTDAGFNSIQSRVACSDQECSVFYAVDNSIRHYKLLGDELTREPDIGNFKDGTSGAGYLFLSKNADRDYLLTWSAQINESTTNELSVSFAHYSAHSGRWSQQQDVATGPGLYYAPNVYPLTKGFTLYWHDANPWDIPTPPNTYYADILTAE